MAGGIRPLLAVIVALLGAVAAPSAFAQTGSCPCSIWSGSPTPAVEAVTSDTSAVELGVKFRPTLDGQITGLRFYKGSTNTGTHVGHLWSRTGTMLAEATFTGESARGWQQVSLPSPVPVTAGTTYIASYHTPRGNYAFDRLYFASAGVDNPPLNALASGVDGGNGVYRYGPSRSFPTSTFEAANYWIDVVFQTSAADTTQPTVIDVSPANGAAGVAHGANVTATFSEAMDAATINGATVELRGPGGVVVPATVAYDAGTRRAVLDPAGDLDASTGYSATVRGGPNGVTDRAGNALAADRTWSFTTAAPAPPPPDGGPGGPILVITKASAPFTSYYAEILRAEGLNAFTTKDVSTVTPADLAAHDVAILGEMSLTSAQVGMLVNWVGAGGNLITMRPDPQLAGLLGLVGASGTLGDAYLRVDISRPPGTGTVDQTMQFHGTADRYVTNGAATLATLYATSGTATVNPAVTLNEVGSNGGQAAAFTFDLARSVVYTRQGNPAWAGQERDGMAPIRSDDLFFGGSLPDWTDLTRVAIPQADELQRLLAKLIGHVNSDRKPLPRFWYFPRGEKAVVVMTGDDHANGGTAGRFNAFRNASPAGCSVAQWECVRGTSYIYPNTPLSDSAAAAYVADGFEIGLHVNTNCANWTPASLQTFYAGQLAAFASEFPSVPEPTTNRTHCIVWSDWVTQPKVELARGIRFDTNYYYWPPGWVDDTPGLFTGSGMPMRFADRDGTTIDVYQATTQMTDESGQSYPFTVNTLLDRALGPTGYYGAFTANMHTDSANSSGSTAIVASALSRGVPVVSARQMLDWLDGRNSSSFGSVAWSDDTLDFRVSVGAGATGLRGMLPMTFGARRLATLTRDGAAVSFTSENVKGIEYAFFPANGGAYRASYGPDTPGPPPEPVSASPGATVVQSGTAAGGNAAALSADDNVFFQVSSTRSGTRTTAWYGSFAGVPNALTDLRVSYTGRNSASCTQTVHIWRWTTSSWVQLSSRSVGTAEVALADLIPVGAAADYVSGTTGDGELRVRIRCTRSSNFVAAGELMRIAYQR